MNPPPNQADIPPICDYEGSDYRTRFWEDENRDYEDLAERIAIRSLLPPRGGRLLEIGTGFGRLVDLYQGYRHVLLLDYSKSMLREAQQRLSRPLPGRCRAAAGTRYTYIAADVYRMPLVDGLVDTTCMVRVIHHVADVPAALAQIYRTIRPGGTLILEFANKRHLKSIARHLVRRQAWNPFDPEPIEFVPLNFDFHPHWMRARLEEQGFAVERTRTVSHFRVPLLKRLIPARTLAALDGAVQWTGQYWTLTPSVFVRARSSARAHSSARARKPVHTPRLGGQMNESSRVSDDDPVRLFRCPACAGQRWQEVPSELRCQGCGARWAVDDGIYDFKTAL